VLAFANKCRALESAASYLGTREPRTDETRAGEVRALEPGVREVGAFEVASTQVGGGQVDPGQTALREIDAGQVRQALGHAASFGVPRLDAMVEECTGKLLRGARCYRRSEAAVGECRPLPLALAGACSHYGKGP